MRAFDSGVGREANAAREREIERLHAKIGRLTVERHFSLGGPDDERPGQAQEAQSGARRSIDPVAMRAAVAGARASAGRLRPMTRPTSLLMWRIDELFKTWLGCFSARVGLAEMLRLLRCPHAHSSNSHTNPSLWWDNADRQSCSDTNQQPGPSGPYA